MCVRSERGRARARKGAAQAIVNRGRNWSWTGVDATTRTEVRSRPLFRRFASASCPRFAIPPAKNASRPGKPSSAPASFAPPSSQLQRPAPPPLLQAFASSQLDMPSALPSSLVEPFWTFSYQSSPHSNAVFITSPSFIGSGRCPSKLVWVSARRSFLHLLRLPR